MPSEGHRLHGFTVVSGGLRLGRQFLLPAILGGASVGDGFGAVVQWTFVILAVPSIVVAIAQWLAFRYRLEEDELIIQSGVLSRRRRVIPLDRIQNVDLKRSAFERLAGVAELRLETASGGSDTEASLAVLDIGRAHELQARLRERRARKGAVGGGEAAELSGPDAEDLSTPDDTQADRPEERRLLELSFSDLVIAGATSNEAGLIAAGLATGMELLDDVGALQQADAWLQGLFEQGAELGVTGVVLFSVAMAVAFFVLGWLVSMVATVVRYWGFTLTLAGDDLRREYGLLSRHQSTVPLKRVQAVRIEQSLLRRPLGLAELKIETAGFGPQQRQNAQGGAEAYVPITRHRDVGRLVRAVFDDARFEDVAMHAVAPVSQRRSFARLAAPLVLVTAIAAWFETAALAAAALLVPAWFLARAQYRAKAWARPEGYAIVRHGVITRTNAVIPERRIQTLHLSETPFQRRLGLATLEIDTAGGGSAARAIDLHHPTARSLLLDLAHDAEHARKATLQPRT